MTVEAFSSLSGTSRRLLSALQFLALGLVALHLLSPLLSESTWWGVWPASNLPTWARWAGGLTVAFLALWGEPLWSALQPGGRHLLDRLRLGSARARILIALASALPFFLFRIQHLRWGDAYILSVAIPHPEVRLTYVWQAPLDVFLHARLWQEADRLFGLATPVPVYRVLSIAAGVAFVWLALSLAAWVGRDRAERWLVAGLVLTLGTMQLFFGYVENYTLMAAGMLLYAWLALRCLRNQLSIVWPATALAVTHALHPSTIMMLLPSLLALVWLRRSQEPLLRQLVKVGVPYVLVFIAVVALMSSGRHGLDALAGVDFPGGGDRSWFVPLRQITTKWQHYTMLSPGHLLDIVNQQLIAAPVVWPAFGLALLLAWQRIPSRDPEFRLLAVMAGVSLLLTLTWNPDYGGQRDWDLFSTAAIPAALLLSYTLARVLPERPALRGAWWALVMVQAYHLAAWVYTNTLPLQYPA